MIDFDVNATFIQSRPDQRPKLWLKGVFIYSLIVVTFSFTCVTYHICITLFIRMWKRRLFMRINLYWLSGRVRKCSFYKSFKTYLIQDIVKYSVIFKLITSEIVNDAMISYAYTRQLSPTWVATPHTIDSKHTHMLSMNPFLLKGKEKIAVQTLNRCHPKRHISKQSSNRNLKVHLQTFNTYTFKYHMHKMFGISRKSKDFLSAILFRWCVRMSSHDKQKLSYM